jgi:hypothetical protein
LPYYKILTKYQYPRNRQRGDADDVPFNLPNYDVPASSIEYNSNDEMYSAAKGADLFESGQEALEDSDDAHVVVIQKILDFVRDYDEVICICLY